MEKLPVEDAIHEEVPTNESNSIHDVEASKLNSEAHLEHELTITHVLTHHKALAGWSFFWALCAIGWGFDAQVNGAMISVPAFRRDFGYVYKDEYVLPADWQSAFNIIGSPGQFLGGFLCSGFAERFGRKPALLLGVIFCTGGILGQMFSTARVAFLISKLILGFGLGFYLTLGPMMTSELTPVVLRGVATSGINLGIAIGQLLSNSVIKGFGSRSDRWAYRGPFAIQLAFVCLLLGGYYWAPESPIYLVKKGRHSDARAALRIIWGDGIDIDAKLMALQATIAEEHDGKKDASFIDCFRGTNRIRTVISMGVFVCQHAVGIIFVLGFSSYFFQLAGLDVSKSFDLGVGVTACGVAGNVVSWFLINKIGRRPIFNLGMGTLTAMLFLIGILDVVHTSAAKWVQAAVTVIWAFIYFLTIGAMAFAILGETSSASLRAHTAALATATQAVMGIAMNFAIPYMVNPDEGNLKGKVGFVFGGLGLISTIWSFFYVPELKGRTFREIDHMFMAHIPPRKMGSQQVEF